MPEYVDKKAVLDIIRRTSGDYASAFSEVRQLQPADAVSVIRCKDCDNWMQTSLSFNQACLHYSEPSDCYYVYTNNDEFCSHAKEKDKSTAYCSKCGRKTKFTTKISEFNHEVWSSKGVRWCRTVETVAMCADCGKVVFDADIEIENEAVRENAYQKKYGISRRDPW